MHSVEQLSRTLLIPLKFPAPINIHRATSQSCTAGSKSRAPEVRTPGSTPRVNLFQMSSNVRVRHRHHSTVDRTLRKITRATLNTLIISNSRFYHPRSISRMITRQCPTILSSRFLDLQCINLIPVAPKLLWSGHPSDVTFSRVERICRNVRQFSIAKVVRLLGVASLEGSRFALITASWGSISPSRLALTTLRPNVRSGRNCRYQAQNSTGNRPVPSFRMQLWMPIGIRESKN
jgi:hypothetical protein